MRSSLPDNVDGTRKVPGLFPALTAIQWNAVCDVLTAEELSATPNSEALKARDSIRSYLIQSGYRRRDVA